MTLDDFSEFKDDEIYSINKSGSYICLIVKECY